MRKLDRNYPSNNFRQRRVSSGTDDTVADNVTIEVIEKTADHNIDEFVEHGGVFEDPLVARLRTVNVESDLECGTSSHLSAKSILDEHERRLSYRTSISRQFQTNKLDRVVTL